MVSPALQQEITQAFGLVPSWFEQLPSPTQAQYWGLMRDFYLAETAIPAKYKEFIGLGVSAATRCKYCALFHTEAAKLHGATPQEIAEANAMASLTMGLSTFINGQQIDYDQFRKDTEAVVAHVRRTLATQSRTSTPRGR